MSDSSNESVGLQLETNDFVLEKYISRSLGQSGWSVRKISLIYSKPMYLQIYSKDGSLKEKNNIILGFDMDILKRTTVMNPKSSRYGCYISRYDDHVLLGSASHDSLNEFITTIEQELINNHEAHLYFNMLVTKLLTNIKRQIILGINGTCLWIKLIDLLTKKVLKSITEICWKCAKVDYNKTVNDKTKLKKIIEKYEADKKESDLLESEVSLKYNTMVKYQGDLNLKMHKLALCGLRLLLGFLEGPNGYKGILLTTMNIWRLAWVRGLSRSELKLSRNANPYINVCDMKTKSNDKNNQSDRIEELASLTRQMIRIKELFANIKNSTSNIRSLLYSQDKDNEYDKISIVKQLQYLADVRHQLQSYHNEGEEFILVGDQSAGKSSLLAALLGVNITYISDGCATRCPVKYILEPTKPDSGWSFECDNGKGILVSYDQSNLQKRLNEHFKSLGDKLVSEPITVRILSPVCTSSMTVVDLPGLIAGGIERQENHEQSHQIVREYLNKPNVIVLYVSRFDVDVGSTNTYILSEVQKKTPDNVVYCFTHFDRAVNDSDISVEDLAKSIKWTSENITKSRPMFLLSLPKKTEDLVKKEMGLETRIQEIKKYYSKLLEKRKVNIGMNKLKNSLRKRMHKHVMQLGAVLQQYVMTEITNIGSKKKATIKSLNQPDITDHTMDKFLHLFRRNMIRMLKGRFIPLPDGKEMDFFEDLTTEINTGNNYCKSISTMVWPEDILEKINNKSVKPPTASVSSIPSPKSDLSSILSRPNSDVLSLGGNDVFSLNTEDKTDTLDLSKPLNEESFEIKEESNDLTEEPEKEEIPLYQRKLDPSLRRQLVSHSIFTRTIYELQARLWNFKWNQNMKIFFMQFRVTLILI